VYQNLVLHWSNVQLHQYGLIQEIHMTGTDNKSVYLHFAAAVNHRNLDALDPLVAPDWMNHGAGPNEPPGAERFKRIFAHFIAACPDFQITVEDQLAEDDKVMVRWRDTGTHTAGPLLGVLPTGKAIVLTGIDVLRIKNGQIIERWSESDQLYLLQTLGIVPS
jgi:predicted ester cyclase